MDALEFDQKLRERLLNLRQSLNRGAQCTDNANDALRRALL